MNRILLYIFLISLLSSPFLVLNAQTGRKDTTVVLKTVDINSERLHKLTAGLKIETIDSLTLSHYISDNLTDILSSQTTLYLKSYGLGSVADISIRGTSAEQNAILWNGFNINVPNIGLSDFALVHGSFFNKIEILYGGASSVYGNGIIGGSVHLENEPVFSNQKSFDISSSVGSFDIFNENLRAVIANDQLYSVTALTLNSAENNFPFTNTTEINSPEERQTNAKSYSNGIMQQFSDKLTESQTLDAAVWYQYANREIPPELTESVSKADIIDESLRSTLQWKKTTDDMSFIAKGAYFYDFENYTDPLSSIYSKIINNTGIIDLEMNKHFFCRACAEANDSGKTHSASEIQDNSFDFNAGINYTLNEADISDYDGSKQRYDAAVFATVLHNFTSVNWIADINIRQEFTQGYSVPLTPSLGMEGRIWKFISGRLNVSQNFRIPTLNELYWLPGNPNIKPETSFNEEAGIIIKPNSVHGIELNFTIYNSYVNNLIQWVQDTAKNESGKYIAENVEKVWNRGAEFKGKYSFSIANCILSINLAYSYTISTNEEKLSALDNSYGKQLIYVPVNNALASVSFDYKTFEFNYSQNYVGRRYTESDDSYYLAGYSLGNFYISKQFKVNHTGFGLQFSIDNIWNVPYEAIAYMPMPGRFFRFTLNFKIS